MTNPDAVGADHITVLSRGNMKVRDCKECRRKAAFNSGDPIDHADDCPHARGRSDDTDTGGGGLDGLYVCTVCAVVYARPKDTTQDAYCPVCDEATSFEQITPSDLDW